MNPDNILVITGNQLRHRYFVNHLNFHFHLAAVLIEPVVYPEPPPSTHEEAEAWQWFFSRREAYELEVFEASDHLPPRNHPVIVPIPPGELNSREVFARLRDFDPGLILVYGTSLLGPEILRRYPEKIFNLHVGLPQFCRGSSCNFWPIHNRRLDFLGAAIHLVAPGIDSGDLVSQETVRLEKEDDEQSLIGKTLILGTRLMIDTVRRFRKGTLNPIPQKDKGKLFLMKEFTPQAVLEVKTMVESGELEKLIARHLKSR